MDWSRDAPTELFALIDFGDKDIAPQALKQLLQKGEIS